jgi:tetratricopeptide (TPR) repeat protein
MDPGRWQKVSELFLEAMDTPPEHRTALLRQKCANDPELRDEVQRMLDSSDEAEEQVGMWLKEAGVTDGELQERLSNGETGAAVPDQVGPYRLIRELGRGGMGSVWLADRIEGGFTQSVAIKFVKLGMDTREILTRFRQERQILSLLNHPNIAKLLDGGETPDGRPYLVMEFVDGTSAVDYCRDQPIPVILSLFRTICTAVQHAHSNLVIHRDLKPSNVMITPQGEVKLLDFGIAKLLEQDAGSLETQTGFRLFTPGFASPEQQAGLPCSTATDVYSLGAMLRAMLPADPGADLQAIILRATREEPALRYPTVEQLSVDVQRHEQGKPVEARKGNFAYVAGKFLRRYRWPVTAAAAFLVLLTGSLISTIYQGRQIAKERDRAEAVSSFLVGLFAAADPQKNQGNNLTIAQLLDDGLNRARAIENATMRQPLIETIATAYLNLGLYDKSVPVLEEMERAYKQLGAGYGPRLALTQGNLAEAESARGHRDAAEAWGSRAVETARMLQADPETTALVLRQRCIQLHQAAKFDLATAACRQARAAADRSKSLAPASRARILVALGVALQDDNNQWKDAEEAYQAAMPFASAASAAEINSASAEVLSGLASLYYRQDKFSEAEAALRRAIEFKRKLYPNGHLDLARALNNLANILASQDRNREAVAVYEEAHKYYRGALGPESSELASSLSNLAMTKTFLKEFEPAAKLMEQVIDMQARTAGAGQLPHLNSQIKYASIVGEDLGQPARARPVLESALAGFGKLKPQPAMQIGYAKSMLAYCMLEAGQPVSAEKFTREAEEGLRRVLPPGHRVLTHVHVVRAGALVRLGQKADARALLEPVILQEAKNTDPGWRTRLARRYWSELGGSKQ